MHYFINDQYNINHYNRHMHSSMHTQFKYQEIPGLSYAPSNQTLKNQQPSKQVYLARLESTIKQYSSVIRSNKPAIQQLQIQRKFFKKIYEKQRQKLSSINISLIRQQYQNQLKQLRQKRTRMHEMINSIHQQHQTKQQGLLQMSKNLIQNRKFLQTSLIELHQNNRELQDILRKKRQVLQMNQEVIVNNKQHIADKQIIQNKYQQTLQMISKLEGS